MINTRKFSTYLTIVLIVLLFVNTNALAQLSQEACLPDREYVISVGDRLSIEELSSGRKEQRTVLPDGRIQVQGIEEALEAAGLKLSTLEFEIEKRFLKYLKDPQVTVFLAGSSSSDIQIRLRGVISRKIAVPQGTTIGRFLNGIIPQLQKDQVPLDLEAIQLIAGVKGYKLTERSLENLRREGIPEETLIKLKDLEEQQYTSVRDFISDLEERIGHQTQEYRVPILQYAEAVRERCNINGTNVIAGRDVNADIRLGWGDEIFIPSPDQPPPSSDDHQEQVVAPPPSLKKRAQFTLQEYDEFQENYPAAQEILQPFVTSEDDNVYIDLEAIPEDQLNELGDEVLNELLRRTELQEVVPSFADHIMLMGITVNLVLEDLKEAFLAFSGQDLDEGVQEGVQIESFQEGDIVEKGGTETDDIMLEEIREDENQIILKKGEEQQVLTLPPKFSDITLSGILAIGGTREAILGNLKQNPPLQRKRFKKGDKLEGDILLAELSKKWVLLEKGEDIQLVFLRDPSKRISQAASSEALPGQEAQIPGTETSQPPQPGSMMIPEALKEKLPEPLQAMDLFSRMFFATPLF